MRQFGRGQGKGTGGGSNRLAPMTTDRASRRQVSEPTLSVLPENHLTTALNAWAEVFSHREHNISEKAQLKVSEDLERQGT